MDTRSLGQFGEDTAAKYLRRHGYKILDRNCRFRQGELDIVASDRNYIIFAEVKLRKNSDFGEASEFVNSAKQRRLIAAAQMYLQQHETELQPRFDVIEIYAPEGIATKKPEINHIENAF